MNPVLNIVHMGDSITFGQYVDPAIRWTALVEERLRAALGDGAAKSTTVAVCGETTRMGLERYPGDVQDNSPGLLTLQYGMNDCNCWETDRGAPRVSEPAFRANLVEMIDRARRFGARHVILSTNPRTLRTDVVMPSGEIYEDANARYSEIIRQVAADTEVDLCDVRAGFDLLSDAELAEMLHPDLLHLSVAGNAYYADLISPPALRAASQLLGLAEPAAF